MSILADSNVKPEHITHLHGDELVAKNHPIIAFRCEMDTLIAMLAEAGSVCAVSSRVELHDEISEIIAFAQQILRCEVIGEAFAIDNLAGHMLDEYREMSHNTRKYFGFDHPTPCPDMGIAALRLNTIRMQVRRAELAAVNAFLHDDELERTDIVAALNRLSSVVYVLFCKELADIK